MARGGAVTELITLAGGDQEAGAPLSPRGSQNLTKCIGITSVPDAFVCRIDLKIEDFRIAREGPGVPVGIGPRPAPLKAEASLSAMDGDFPPLPPNDQIDAGMFQKAPANGWNPGRGADRIKDGQLFVGGDDPIVFPRFQDGSRRKEALPL